MPRRGIVVTFDDGLKEQYELALPILDKLGIPAIFFVDTSVLDGQSILNVQKIHLLRANVAPTEMIEGLKIYLRAIGKHLDFDYAAVAGGAHYKYDGVEAAKLKYALNFLLSATEQHQFVDRMFDEKFGADRQSINEQLYMSKEQICDLAQRGLLGSHGEGHRPVGLMDEHDQVASIAGSRRTLERMTGCAVAGFSYPYGSAEAVGNAYKQVAAAGYSFAFTMERAGNRDMSNPYVLARYDNNDLPMGKSWTHADDRMFEHARVGSRYDGVRQ